MKSTTNPKKQTGRITSIVLMIALLMVSGLMAISVHAEDVTTWLDISKGNIVIGDGTVSGYDSEGNEITAANTEGYTITGTSTEYSVQITGGTHNIILNDANISFTDGSGEGGQLEDTTNAGTTAFDIQGGTVTLTLVGNNTLQSGVGRAGLSVAYGATAIIDGEGALTAIGGDGGAGIGGSSFANAGTINIIGGYVTATGNGGGAGIGGGHSNDVIQDRGRANQYGAFTAVNISGGTVIARSSGEAPAIGTGDSARSTGSITISDALVIAETAGNCPAIGAYNQNVTSTISITDSIVYASNSESNANSIRGTVTSATSIIEATMGTYTQGSPSIGSDVTLPEGYTLTVAEGYSLTMEEGYTFTNNGTIINIGSISATESIVNNGTITNFGTITGSLLNNGNTTNVGTIAGEVLAASTGALADASATEYPYLDASGTSQTCSSFTVLTPTITTWDEGWYVVAGIFEIDSRITVNGNVHLILLDGCSLTVNGGIGVGSEASLTVYAQSMGDAMGKLIAQNCGNYYAGIGGGDGTQNGTSASGIVTINGGQITATGGMHGAGIGGGGKGATGAITVNGGVINAVGGTYGAGIGGGNGGTVNSIAINAGTVNATGGTNGAGVGGGNGCAVNNITIAGGTIQTVGGNGGAGIGGGNGGTVNTLFINNGTIIATGGASAAGIGAGESGTLNSLIINKGTVTAIGGTDGAGIGSGNEGTVVSIIINDGNITATGGSSAAGIGGGAGANGGSVTINDGYIVATAGASAGGGYNNTAAGIGSGAGYRGNTNTTFYTSTTGSAIVKTSSISDNDDTSDWSGIIFEGADATVYGTQIVTENYTVEEGEVLYIGEGASLTVAEGVTLTNNGTIVIYGTFTANGTVSGSGRLAYPVENDFTDISSSNNTGYAYTGENYTVTLSVGEGFLLPLNVEVTLDGAALTLGTHYTYDSETGELAIFKDNITGVIGITAMGAKIYDVWIGDVQITDRNKDNVLAGTDNDGKISYDPDTDTLSLNGATVTGAAEQNNGSAIYSESALALFVTDENTVTAANVTSGDSIAIYVNGNLTVNGEGNMTVTGANGGSASVAIQALGFELDEATVVAKGGAATAMSAGIRVTQRQFAVNGGNITAEGGAGESSYGIVAVNLIINDGTVNAIGATESIDASRITVSPLLNHLVHVMAGEDATNAVALEDSPLAIETVITKLASDSKYLFVESKVIKSILTIEKTNSNEDTLEDTYTIYYTDGSTDQFVVTNGRTGSVGETGITPELRINEGSNEWEVSYDGGENWTSLGINATGADGSNGTDGINGVDGGVGVAVASIIISSVAMIGCGAIVAIYFIKRKKGGIV